MATLQKIRNQGGVLVAVIIGLALLAFILGDFLNSGPSAFSRKRLEVAEIAGVSIDYMDYNAKIEELSEFYRVNYQISSLDAETQENIRTEIWRTTLRDVIMGASYKDLGIFVSVEELKTMLMGDSINTGGSNVIMDEPHPMVRRMFTNPETGEFNRYQMMNYFNAISDDVYKDERKRWIYLENQIVDERMNQKYFALVQKGLAPNSIDAKNYAYESESNISFDFVFQRFTSIPDESISFSDADITAYYDEHKKEFKQDDTRSIEYVIFNIAPSAADDQNAKEYVEQSKVAFSRSENPISFVNTNSDIPYAEINYAPEDLPAQYVDSFFNADAGQVIGPWFENNSYKLARHLGFTTVSDSVRARHILISLSVQRDDARAKTIADSLKQLILGGADFNALAANFSADQSNSSIGGDLGWFAENTILKPISDFCFENNTSDVDVVKTNNGYHVLKIEEQSPKRKKAQLAILEKQVVPSDETYQTIYSNAVQFGSEAKNLEGFRKLYAEKGITPRFASDFLKDINTLPGLEYSREIIRWSFENDKGSVSQIFDLNDKYIIAALSDVKEKGYASKKDKLSEIEIAVSKMKKLEKLAEETTAKISSANDIDAVASALGSEVVLAEKVRLSNPYISTVGLEPSVVALSYTYEPGTISKPIIGANGVFVLQVNEKNIPENLDIASAIFRMKYFYDSRVSYQGYDALIDKAEVNDKRINFY
ncbi:MAG: SurA N-terminal domain-containing protein [Bacteroidales bacterium]|nr:SurA N-terminal domain-containing protein [Bacteroidales bacterium]MCF8390845.1 SurA N-terminal domain-containing protein [Bacteroidales bacterium]